MKRSLLVFALVTVLGLIALADGVGVTEYLGFGGGGSDVTPAEAREASSSGRAGEALALPEDETPNQTSEPSQSASP